jgi:amino-acid N-acetyltransferase
MNDVNIRPAASTDLPAVRTLLQRASLPLDGVQDFFPAHYTVAEQGQQVVAAIGVETYGKQGLLRSAVVADELRGSGLGSELARERLQWSKTIGLDAVYLLTTTAAPFFDRLGFARVDRSAVPADLAAAPEFASICPSTAIVMRIDLTEGTVFAKPSRHDRRSET